MSAGAQLYRGRIVQFPLQYYRSDQIGMPHLLDVQNVFPKRLGIMNGNTLVVQYYDLGRDKFKKHPIPFNPLEEVKTIIDQIYKNVRHIPFLKKIDPKHLKAVIEGQSVLPKKQQIAQPPAKPNFQKFAQILTKKDEKRRQDKFEQSLDKSNILSISQASNKGAKAAKVQQAQDYYGESFQQFQISQSMDKQKNISISNVDKSKPSFSQSQPSHSKVDPPSISISKPKSEVNSSSLQKSKESEQKVVEQIIEEEYADDFEFVEEVKEEKKQKKEKKEKKEKKQKSKQKKPKKEKKQKGGKVQVKEVEEQFQFL